ncbi:hypothetical protein MMPV_009126 [Pyropia vietnamensis]
MPPWGAGGSAASAPALDGPAGGVDHRLDGLWSGRPASVSGGGGGGGCATDGAAADGGSATNGPSRWFFLPSAFMGGARYRSASPSSSSSTAAVKGGGGWGGGANGSTEAGGGGDGWASGCRSGKASASGGVGGAWRALVGGGGGGEPDPRFVATHVLLVLLGVLIVSLGLALALPLIAPASSASAADALRASSSAPFGSAFGGSGRRVGDAGAGLVVGLDGRPSAESRTQWLGMDSATMDLNRQRAPLVADRSFLVISGDDWGRVADSVPLFPNNSHWEAHADLHIANGSLWYARAGVETVDDVRRLAHFLRSLNAGVPFSQQAVLTPHWVVGGPDFEAMRSAWKANAAAAAVGVHGPGSRNDMDASDAAVADDDLPAHAVPAYQELPLSRDGPFGLERAPYHRPSSLRFAYLDLFRSGLWHPEFHGRSHFGTAAWLSALRTDTKARACFAAGLVCATDPAVLRSEFSEAALATVAAARAWLRPGVDAFEAFWGYRPAVMSSPHNVWTGVAAAAVAAEGMIGAEMGEDQAWALDAEAGVRSLSLHDRFRFDVFFPGFDCDAAIEGVLAALAPSSSAASGSANGTRRPASRTTSGPPPHVRGGDNARFISLMWHAQNAMAAPYARGTYEKHMRCLSTAVRAVRAARPRAVFLTASELHQVRSRGWSVETWSDSLVVRNYGLDDLAWTVADLGVGYKYAAGSGWAGRSLLVEDADAGEGAVPLATRRGVRVGDVITIPSDAVVRVRVAN